MKLLHSNVPALMSKHGITTAYQLRQRTGLGYATCWRLTNGGQIPHHKKTVKVLCDLFGVDPGSLYTIR